MLVDPQSLDGGIRDGLSFQIHEINLENPASDRCRKHRYGIGHTFFGLIQGSRQHPDSSLLVQVQVHQPGRMLGIQV
jgi:hypothetical protein